MTMWLLAIGLIVFFAALGYFKGAIRMSVGVVGVFLGIMLAIPFGPMLRPVVSALGVKNPVWLALIPPAAVFLLVYLVFVGVSFFIHHKVSLHYKYKRDDIDRLRWERVNARGGAALGVFTGIIFFFLLGAVIYPGGYVTTQIYSEENDPALISFLRSARKDMSEAGLDNVMAKLDPAPPRFYLAADVLGLLYHNPLLQARLASYPYFISLTQRPEFQEMATDQEYNDLVFGKAPITDIIKHPRTEGIMNTPDLMEYFKGADLVDLREYLRTGRSEKYSDEPLLGVWHLDRDAVFLNIRKMFPDIRSRDLAALRIAFDTFPSVTISASPDKRVFVQASAISPVAPPQEVAAPDPMMERYGIRNQPQPQPQQRPTPQAAVPGMLDFSTLPTTSTEGAWKEEGGRYILSLPLPNGKTADLPAIIKEDQLILQAQGVNLVFLKQEV